MSSGTWREPASRADGVRNTSTKGTVPLHATYLETHLGGGAIMKRKPPAQHNIGIDLDPQVLRKFRCEYPVELVNGCAHRFLAEYDYWSSKGDSFIFAQA